MNMFTKNKKALSPEQKLEQGRGRVHELFDGFRNLANELNTVNKELHEAEVENDKKISSLESQLNSAKQTKTSIADEKKMNNGLRRRIEDHFVPSQSKQGGNQ